MLIELTHRDISGFLEGGFIYFKVQKRTGFQLVGWNDKRETSFFCHSFSFLVIPAKAGIQFFISGVNYKGNTRNF